MYITDINIQSMWGETTLNWQGLDPHVNILVGQNGFGKTTMLNLIKAALMNDDKFIKGLKARVDIKFSDGSEMDSARKTDRLPDGLGLYYVNTFDVPASKKSNLSQLGISLDQILYQRNPDVYSFSDYRLGMLRDLKTALDKQTRIDHFFELINDLFRSTGKEIGIDDMNRVIFRKMNSLDAKGKPLNISMDRLSAGEKQILLLLFTLFLMEDKPTILLLDEPEISLHIEWQDKLVGLMLELNRNCQIIMTTHSPNIFADGWEDKLVFISDLVLTANPE